MGHSTHLSRGRQGNGVTMPLAVNYLDRPMTHRNGSQGTVLTPAPWINQPPTDTAHEPPDTDTPGEDEDDTDPGPPIEYPGDPGGEAPPRAHAWCPRCNGTGIIWSSVFCQNIECPRCLGVGK